jgi:DNA modification methylase
MPPKVTQVEFLIGNAIEQLRTLPDRSVHAVITSPPYWGLRDYSTQPQIWPSCHNPCADGNHEWVEHFQTSANGQTAHAMGAKTPNETGAARKPPQADFCAKCHAWRGQLGLEPTPELYVTHLVMIFREVRRVLRDDGVMWLNLGDSYWGGKGQSARGDPERLVARLVAGKTINKPYQEIGGRGKTKPGDGKHDTIKPKDLVMIPFRVALALQADGWYLRSVSPWFKRNGMPESVRDRPTTSHEYWFMLTKSPRYFWDAEAVRKPLAPDTLPRHSRGVNENKWTHGVGNAASLSRPERFGLLATKPHALHQPRANRKYDGTNTASNGTGIRNHTGNSLSNPAGRNRRTSDAFIESLDELIDETREYLAHLERVRQGNAPLLDEDGNLLALYYSTQSFHGAHFATFSERMITPLVLGSTSARGVCPKCGAPWERVTEPIKGVLQSNRIADRRAKPKGDDGRATAPRQELVEQRRTVDWRPTCTCDAGEPIPATILDPFSGAGTTQLVALKHGRNAIYIDLKPEYAEMARQRLAPILEGQ